MRNLGAVLDHEEPLPHPACAISRNSAIVASASHRPCVRALDEDIAPAKFVGTTGPHAVPVTMPRLEMKEAAN